MVNLINKTNDAVDPAGDAVDIAELRIAKVDDAARIVYGYAIISEIDGEPYYDSQGDFIPEDVMYKAANDFMAGARNGKIMHQGDAVGQVIHSFPLTNDIAKAFGMDAVKTGWIIGMHIGDVDLLEKFKSGELSGFSIGGRGHREAVAEEE